MQGKLLGPYRLLKLIGTGATSDVWLAEVEDPVLGLRAGRRIALKVCRSRFTREPEARERLRREVEMGRSVRHENVVRTYGLKICPTEEGECFTIAMEYVEGQTLRDLLKELGWCAEELCRHIGRKLAAALAAVHDARIIHRDVKPENVLITRDEVVKLMDLGVARLKDEAMRLSLPGSFVGTPLYGAPEQFRRGGEDLDGRTDLYALGILLYELATGGHPISSREPGVVIRWHLNERPSPPSEKNPQISPFLEELILTLLEKGREERFPSALALLEVLISGEDSPWWRRRSVALRGRRKRHLHRIRIPRETGVYGRDAEFGVLRDLFEKVRGGEGRVALIEGEAGIGKSRLVDEFAGRLEREGEDFSLLYGAYPPGGGATAAGAISSSFLHHLGTEDLEKSLATRLESTAELVPHLAAWLRGDPLPSEESGLTRETLETLFVRLARSIAADRPTIMFIDDLHFAPPEARAVFASLTHALSEDRVLLVGTTRPGLPSEWLSTLERLPQVKRLRLPRLGARDLQILLEDALGSDRLAGDLGGAVAVKSDGNPFFVFEILTSLKEKQVIARDDSGTWIRTGTLKRIEIPDTVKDLVRARISNLEEGDRDLLDVAACAGFEFDPVLVGEVLGMGRIPVLKKLTLLSRRTRLVHAVGREFVFDHHQVREALYESLSELLREDYHAAIADALVHREADKTPVEMASGVAVTILDHLLRADRNEEARPYLTVAFDALEASFNYVAFDDLVGRALAVPGLVGDRDRFELLMRLGRGRQVLGRWPDARRTFEEADELAGRLSDPLLKARSLLRNAGMRAMEGKFGEAKDLGRAALRISRNQGDRPGEIEAWRMTGVQLRNLGRLRAAEAHLRRSLAISEEAGDDLGMASSRAMLARLYDQQGRFEAAEVHHEEAILGFRRAGHRLNLAISIGNYGGALYSRRRFEEARAKCEEHRKLCRALGYRRGEMIAESNLGSVHRALGDLRPARDSFARNLVLFREAGDLHGEAVSRVQLAETDFLLGEFERARDLAREALETFQALSDRYWEAVTHLTLGRLSTALDEEAQGLRQLGRAVDLLRQIASPPSLVDGLIFLGRHFLESGQGPARETLAEAHRLAAGHGLAPRAAQAAALLSLLPGEDPAAAVAAYREAERGMEFVARLEAAWCLHRSTGAPEWLEEASSLLDRLLARLSPADRSRMLRRIDLLADVDEARHRA